jgi:hypothetical protein
VAELTVITWRDIPLQVVAREGSASARGLLPDRFQEAVDAAAMGQGMIGSDEYTAEMKMNKRPCGDDLQAEVDAEMERLLEAWPEEVLRAAIRSGGVREDPAE